MRKTNRHKKINGRKKRTLKMRGGDLDDPDTKEYLNSKFEALEQKITELEANIPVQIGYKTFVMTGGAPSNVPLFVNRNISVQDFWKYVGKKIMNHNHHNVTIFLPAIYSLPNIRGLKIGDCVYNFYPGNEEENNYLRNTNVEALNTKYPGLFVR